MTNPKDEELREKIKQTLISYLGYEIDQASNIYLRPMIALSYSQLDVLLDKLGGIIQDSNKELIERIERRLPDRMASHELNVQYESATDEAYNKCLSRVKEILTKFKEEL